MTRGLLLCSMVMLMIGVSGCNMSISFSDGSEQPPVAPVVTATPVTSGEDTATVEVSAMRGWQNSYVLIYAGDRVTVRYVSGLWTQQTHVVEPHDAADRDSGYVCGRSDCVEPYPDYPQGALVGRVGPQLVPIGDEATFIALYTRYLALRMNDGDESLYDNSGSVTVRITVDRASQP